MKYLLIGQNGFLGQDLLTYNRYFSNLDLVSIPKESRWPEKEFKKFIYESNADVILNCISTNNFSNCELTRSIHYELPIWVSENFSGKLINFSSDVSFQLSKGNLIDSKYKYYAENKLEAELKLHEKSNTMTICTSIIGLSKKKSNLINRFFFENTEDTIYGYENVFWSGMTTLQLYHEICNLSDFKFMNNNSLILSSDCVSMHNLFKLINTIFNFGKIILPSKKITLDDRCMPSSYLLPNLEKQLYELNNFFRIH